jgi:heme-degrading monooxygenase HmoA
MIARIWSARTKPENWPAYQRHFTANVVPELRSIDGYAGAKLLKKKAGHTGDTVEITVITFWRSWQAIDAFAGSDREVAVVAPGVDALLIDYDRIVQHHDVVASDSVASNR